MPPIRSSKGKKADDKGKGKAPRNQKDNVEPCELCGVVVSRKSDIARHAKRHAPDSEKLPCPWEGCDFATRQKSNLNTHYRRHTNEKPNICYDDPAKCDFATCDPASLLRHRKRAHGYIPGKKGARRKKNKNKRVPVRIIRGIEAASPGSATSVVASQFFTFSSSYSSAGASTSSGSSPSRPFSASEASTSGSSSSRSFSAGASSSGWFSSRPFSPEASTLGSPSSPFTEGASTSGYSSRPLSPPESPTPSPSPPNSRSCSTSPSPSASASGSHPHQLQLSLSLSPSSLPSSPAASGSQPCRQQSHHRTWSPAHSSGESEVSPTTPVTSTFPPHEYTPEGGPSPTVLSMTSYSVHGGLMHHRDSLLFAPPIKDHIYVDPNFPYTSGVLDGYVVGSSETLEYLDQHPVEVVYDTISMEDEVLSPLFPEKNEWPGIDMAGNLLGPYGLSLDEEQLQQQPSSSSSPMTQIGQHPIIHIGSFPQTHIPLAPIEHFHNNMYDPYYQFNTPPFPLEQCPSQYVFSWFENNVSIDQGSYS